MAVIGDSRKISFHLFDRILIKSRFCILNRIKVNFSLSVISLCLENISALIFQIEAKVSGFQLFSFQHLLCFQQNTSRCCLIGICKSLAASNIFRSSSESSVSLFVFNMNRYTDYIFIIYNTGFVPWNFLNRIMILSRLIVFYFVEYNITFKIIFLCLDCFSIFIF